MKEGESGVCDICGKAFLENDPCHKMTHTNIEDILCMCDICYQEFAQSDPLSGDVQTPANEEEPYVCPTCQKHFPTKLHLQQHQRSHVAKKRHVCEICNESFLLLYRLQRHRLTHTTDETPPEKRKTAKESCASSSDAGDKTLAKKRKTVKENRSSSSDTSDKMLAKNRKTVKGSHVSSSPTSKRPFIFCPTCPICCKQFPNQDELKEHQYEHLKKMKALQCLAFDRSTRLTSDSTMEEGESGVCDFCGKAFSKNDQCHKLKHTNINDILCMCDVCYQEFAQSDPLSGDVETPAKEKEPYVCPTCKKPFTEKLHLQQHQRSHVTEKRHVCEICNESFLLLYRLQRHQLTHTRDRVAPTKRKTTKGSRASSSPTSKKPVIACPTCPICCKQFPNQDELKEHQCEHLAKMKALQCLTFDRSTSLTSDSPPSLMENSTMEEGDSGVCDICGKAFSRNDLCHKMTHTNINDVLCMCDICYQEFAQSDPLSGHLKTPANEKEPYICPTHKKCSTEKLHLQQHQQSHISEKRHVCEICNESFLLLYRLQRHQLIHSRDKMPPKKKKTAEGSRASSPQPKQKAAAFVCPICYKQFLSHDEFKKHQWAHLKRRKAFYCSPCDRSFPSPLIMKIHQRAHDCIRGEKYVCGFCGRRLPDTMSFVRHYETHYHRDLMSKWAGKPKKEWKRRKSKHGKIEKDRRKKMKK